MTLKLAPGLSLPDDTVTQALGILAKRGAGKSNAGAVLAEEMHRAGLQFVAVDPVGAWWGLRSSADGNGAGLPIPVLGGYHGDVPLEPGAGHLIADLVVGERLSAVIDVSAFSEGEKKRFLADFAERLFREKGKPGHEEPLHLFLEEADDYAPQGGTRGGDVGRCLGAFQRIVKQGRARGLCLRPPSERRHGHTERVQRDRRDEPGERLEQQLAVDERRDEAEQDADQSCDAEHRCLLSMSRRRSARPPIPRTRAPRPRQQVGG
jgi:uncharacterized protein